MSDAPLRRRVCFQNTLVIDTPRVRKQTRHYSSVKEDEMLEFSELESDDDEPSKPTMKPRRPQDKAQGYPRSECFRVEKNLLVYGSVTPLHPSIQLSLPESVFLNTRFKTFNVVPSVGPWDLQVFITD